MRLVLLAAIAVVPSLPTKACLEERAYRTVLENAGPLVVLQRAPQTTGIGHVYQSLSYAPGARLTKLEKGVRTPLCCDQFPEMAGVDIQSFDVAFDASSIVFSARIDGDPRYGLYLLPLDDRGEAAAPPGRLGNNPQHDFVYPVFAQRDRIVFVTNENVEAGVPSYNDESQREPATQLGSIGIDGARQELGPKSLSHRISPSLLSDGRVIFTQWEHLGARDEGHLASIAPDFSDLRSELAPDAARPSNTYLKAVEMEPGRLVVIGTSRDRTIQSGKLLDVRLGSLESNARCEPRGRVQAVDLTPDVPESGPSLPGVGRFFSAWPLKGPNGGFGSAPLFLVSWADGSVEQGEVTGDASQPEFGLYLFDSKNGRRLRVLDEPGIWEVMARPLSRRPVPAIPPPAQRNGFSEDAFLLGSVDVDASLAPPRRGSVARVRLIEGFSDEEGFPRDFGSTEYDGVALLGEAKVHRDGSWAALVPPYIPIRIQLVDGFGMAMANEPVWISGRPGESRVCGEGDLESTMAGARPEQFDKPRPARRSNDFGQGRVVGVPWDKALQPIFDAKCVRCHQGVPGPSNRSLTFTDEVGNTQTLVFDLGGLSNPGDYGVGGEMISGYSPSHLSLLGPSMAGLEDAGVEVTGDLPVLVQPGAARDSILFRKLNPPAVDRGSTTHSRRYPGRPVHPVDVGGEELTVDEYALLILMADMGGQFYSRENAPGQSGY